MMRAKIYGLIMMAVLSAAILNGVQVKAAEPGLTEENGKLHYYDDNKELVTDKYAIKITADGKDGYYQIDADGIAIKLTGCKEQAAKKLLTLNAVPADSTNSKNTLKCLKKAFKWSSKLKYVSISKKIKKDDEALEYYADYGFLRSKGDCNVQAATFAAMAQVLGYDATFVRGYVPQALKNGKPANFGSHAWVTIKMDKKKYVFDPNFERTNKAGWKFKYGAKKHYRYFNKKKKEIK